MTRLARPAGSAGGTTATGWPSPAFRVRGARSSPLSHLGLRRCAPPDSPGAGAPAPLESDQARGWCLRRDPDSGTSQAAPLVPAILSVTAVTCGPGVRRRPEGGRLGPVTPAWVPPCARLLGTGVFVGGLEAGDFGVEVGQHGPDGGDPRAQLSGCQACRVLRQLVNCADDPGDRPALDRTHARILAGAGDRTRRGHVNLSWTLGRGCVGSAAVGRRASKARRGPTRQAY